MFRTHKLARRVLAPLATCVALVALVAAVDAGRAFASDDSMSGYSAGADAQPTTASGNAATTSTAIQYAKMGTPPSSVVDAKWCSSDAHWAHACFERSGDVIWIDNGVGEHVKARWENWLRQADGTWVFYRGGDCISLNWGWGYCNQNLYEDSSHNAARGHGSGIRLYTCYGACDADYQWVRNNA